LPTTVLSKKSIAGGIALINGCGGVAGLLAPALMGVLRDRTGNYNAGLLAAAMLSFTAALALLAFRGRRAIPRQSPTG
jgi:MFS transporter, ACS family, tartrate transporter